MPRVPLGLLRSKNPEHSHNAIESTMAHPAFRKFNEQETSQIAQISESLLMSRQIYAQLHSQREYDRPVILQNIYNQIKKIKKDKLQGRRPIYALIKTLKAERSTNNTFSGAFCLMKNETEPSYTWASNQHIEKVLNNTNIVPPPVIVIDRDLALKNSLKKISPDSKVMLCIWHINKDVSAHCMKKIGHGTNFERFMGL
ncbi:hypothetical protein O181_015534 [Austropuccinia psidii MF-1]|uniref:MULE transposase domain-containing protein n=1 Tax=Austropuccinia psidii MF-1 TaxID=1389203 RepID=A0A9Q3C270_9BASI|nr:hypothetical protein [Austropuccinia psidii MF-1]